MESESKSRFQGSIRMAKNQRFGVMSFVFMAAPENFTLRGNFAIDHRVTVRKSVHPLLPLKMVKNNNPPISSTT